MLVTMTTTLKYIWLVTFMGNLVLNQALPSLLLDTTQFFWRTFQTDEFAIRDKMAVILV